MFILLVRLSISPELKKTIGCSRNTTAAEQKILLIGIRPLTPAVWMGLKLGASPLIRLIMSMWQDMVIIFLARISMNGGSRNSTAAEQKILLYGTKPIRPEQPLPPMAEW